MTEPPTAAPIIMPVLLEFFDSEDAPGEQHIHRLRLLNYQLH